jgi:hypothetical protein
MKRVMLLAGIATFAAPPLAGQAVDDSVPAMRSIEISGPRVGMTYVSGPRAMQRLAENGLTQWMSLFGWHFEQVVRPQIGGPSLVMEEVLLVAGLDQGTAIPSASFLMGVRTPSGWELGMGPNVSPMGTALVVGVGKTFRYGGVTIPLNLAFVTSKGALRTSFVLGYGIRRR